MGTLIMKYNVGDIIPFAEKAEAIKYINSVEGGYYLEDYEEERTDEWSLIVRKLDIPELTLEERINEAYKDFDKRVELRLDEFAATRLYSSINSACSYAISTDPQFKMEGEYCVRARDATYRKCHDLLDTYLPAILTGERDIPTWQEIEVQLPPLVWPDE